MNSRMQLENRTAVVTGAASGIGRAIALALDSAAAVDGFIAAIGEQLADRIIAAGFERYLCKPIDPAPI